MSFRWLPLPIVVLLLVAGARAEERWPDERVLPPLVLHADFPLDDHLGLANETAQLQQELQESLGVPRSNELIHLMLFQHKSTYQEYLQLHFDGLPFRRAMFIKSNGPGMVFAYRNSEFEEDVRHECTHALLHSALPTVPLWLDEGLAEYFEVPPEKRAAGHTHLPRVRWLARLRGVSSIEKLERIESLGEMRQSDYRDAWAWVHFMLHGPPAAKDALRGFLEEIRSQSTATPLSKRLHESIPKLNQRVTDHFIRWSP